MHFCQMRDLKNRRYVETHRKSWSMSKFPTHATNFLCQTKSKEMCIFYDASTNAIETVAYIRVTNTNGNVEVGFMFGTANLAA